MEGISSWIAGISAVALMASVISVIAPKNSAGRVAFMIGSMLVLVALVAPIFGFETEDFSEIRKTYEDIVAEKTEAAKTSGEAVKNNIIQDKLTTYVLQEAKTDASECKLTIEVKDERAVSAKIVCRDSAVSKRVSEVLSEDLNIPITAQEIKTEV